MSHKPSIKRRIFIVVGALVALFAIFVASRPANFHIERSITIHAPPEAPFSRVNELRRWTEWSPFEKGELKRSYEGPAVGVGASYAWEGDQTGSGRMTIERSVPASEILIKLDFIKPMAATNTATFTFTQNADGTRVTWSMDGRNGFISKAFSIFFDMDKMIGGEFERGLADLKKVSETDSSNKAAAAH